MNPRVLVIDDSLTVRMDLVELLGAAGFDVEGCASIAAARAALAAGHFDLLVLDVVLPDGDGVEFLTQLRHDPSVAATPVMLLSTEAAVHDRLRGLAQGANEYVGKPYEPAYLSARARELTRSVGRERAARTTILVIDDSLTYREELASVLERGGYEVLTAATGEEGLQCAMERRPHAIVVDGMLPGIDGITVIRRIRLDAALRRTPCILLTGSDEKGAEVRAFEAGADTFIRKQEDAEIVLSRLSAMLRSSAGTLTLDDTLSPSGPSKVLAVDDSPTFRAALAEILRGDGYEVVNACSGEEALELLAVQPVDCVLLDLLMPGIGGQETCRRIKSTPSMRDTPVVMLTMLEDRTTMIAGLEAGADDFISKSSDHQVLRARVVAQIRRKQFEDENRAIRERLIRQESEAAESRAARTLADVRAGLLDDLEEKNRELEAFSYSVSHDLRAPLRAIAGFSRVVLEDHRERLDAQGLDYLERVCAAADRMAELIDALLDLSRVGRAPLRLAEVDLSALAHEVVAELSQHDPTRHVDIRISEALVARGDERLLRIVLENLIGNAWKFTAQREHASIEFCRSSDRSHFIVRDNGAGFDAAYASKLFGPFQRLHAADEFAGTGIGLATVRRIIERHGGRTWGEGTVGAGATFSFSLNAHRQETQ